MRYRREIDGLRAVAVIPVILFHAGVPFFAGGYVGVDIFFVISGYLITSVIAGDLAHNEFSIVKFYERRARRILPVLFCIVAVCIPFAWMMLPPADLRDFSQSVLAVAVFLSNVLFWTESGYFESAAELKPLLHTWSLSVEEQFYLLFPILLIALWRLGKRPMVSALVVLALFSLLLAQGGSATHQAANFFLLPGRFWELLVGAILALALNQNKFRESPDTEPITNRTQVFGAIGVALILLAIFIYDADTPFPSAYTLLPTLGAALIIAFATSTTHVGKLLGARIMVGIGLVSYSAYLWHQPLLAFARVRDNGSIGIRGIVVLLALTFSLAYCSWRFVEQPFRDRNRYRRRTIFSMSAVGAALLAVVGFAGGAGRGVDSWRLSPAKNDVFRTAEQSPLRDECHTEGASFTHPADACTYLDGARISWAVLGDSHAVELAYALALELKERGTGVKHLSFSACEPAFGQNELLTPCQRWTTEAVDYLRTASEINTVVVSYRINQYLFGIHAGVYPAFPEAVPEGRRNQVWESYIAILEALIESGKKVVVVLQAPELSKNVGTIIFQQEDVHQDLRGVSRDWWEHRQRYVYDRLRELPAGVTVVDPAAVLCDSLTCYATHEGVSWYFDDNHLSVSGARLVAKQLLRDPSRVIR